MWASQLVQLALSLFFDVMKKSLNLMALGSLQLSLISSLVTLLMLAVVTAAAAATFFLAFPDLDESSIILKWNDPGNVRDLKIRKEGMIPPRISSKKRGTLSSIMNSSWF
jgi:hypothetical protein